MNQCNRPMLFEMCAQAWVGDKVIAAKQQSSSPGIQNLAHPGFHVFDTGQTATLIIFTVAVVQHF